MMSAAISMLADVEQTKGRPVPGDLFSAQGEQEDVSFAKSLSESVGAAASSEGKDVAGDLAIALPGLKSTTPAKPLEVIAERSGGGKDKPIAAQGTPVQSELKGTVAGKFAPPQMPTVTGLQGTGVQGKMTASGTGTKVEVPAQGQGTVADVSAGSLIPEGTGVSGETDETPAPQVNFADGRQPLEPSVPSGDSPVVWTGTKTAEMVTEGVSLKKPVKAEESAATQKTVQKPAGKIVNAIAVEAKPVTGISMENGSVVVGQVVAPAITPTVAVGGAISQGTEASNKRAALVTKPATGISPVAMDGQARKDIVSGAKPGVIDSAMTVTAGRDPVATAKTETSQQRIPAVAIPAGSDGENKPQVARESGAALLHLMGIVPTAGVSGTPGELAATKIVTRDTEAHVPGLPARSTGQDGAGVLPQSTDEAPRMVAATPTSLEVGIQNGTHGWLKVRAEMTDGGVVNASVSAASSAGQEMLHSELPALTAYLQQEKVAVNAVTVHAASAAGADTRSSSGADGAGGQTPQRSNEGEQQQHSVRKTTLNGSDGTVSYWGLHGVVDDGSLPLAAYVNGGTWLSVRA